MDPHDQPLVHRLIGLHSAWHYRSAVAVAGLVMLLPLLAKLLETTATLLVDRLCTVRPSEHLNRRWCDRQESNLRLSLRRAQ